MIRYPYGEKTSKKQPLLFKYTYRSNKDVRIHTEICGIIYNNTHTKKKILRLNVSLIYIITLTIILYITIHRKFVTYPYVVVGYCFIQGVSNISLSYVWVSRIGVAGINKFLYGGG